LLRGLRRHPEAHRHAALFSFIEVDHPAHAVIDRRLVGRRFRFVARVGTDGGFAIDGCT
jgi:hypothetical protein